jgi:hypothetical protein
MIDFFTPFLCPFDTTDLVILMTIDSTRQLQVLVNLVGKRKIVMNLSNDSTSSVTQHALYTHEHVPECYV